MPLLENCSKVTQQVGDAMGMAPLISGSERDLGFDLSGFLQGSLFRDLLDRVRVSQTLTQPQCTTKSLDILEHLSPVLPPFGSIRHYLVVKRHMNP